MGLSATLPNYRNAATFLRVRPEKGFFFFIHSHMSVPLQIQYVVITEQNMFKRFQLQNEIYYEKVVMQRSNGNHMLIFLYSWIEIGKTTRSLK